MSKQTYLNDREFRRQLKQLLKECTQANSKTIPALRKIGFQVLRHSKHYILRISRNGKTCQYSLSVLSCPK